MNAKKLFWAPTLLLSASLVQAQDAGTAQIQMWLRKQVAATAAQMKPSQTQSISIDHGSTTLVDQSSGSDLLSGALNLIPLGAQSGSGTVTASLYSLYALGSHRDPLQPIFYNANQSWRKVFLTVGREELDQAAANQNAPGTVFGFELLPVNRRDATSIEKDGTSMMALNQVATSLGGAASAAISGIATIISARNGTPSGAAQIAYLLSLTSVEMVQHEIDRLDAADRTRVNLILKQYANDDAAVDSALTTLVSRLQRRYQVALSFQTTQRKPGLKDDYRLSFIFDKGISDRLFFTFNATYDYFNSSTIGGDVRDGRVALDLRWNLANPPVHSLKAPLQVALSGEGLYQGTQWQYRSQLQLQIPLVSGVNLPISVGYGNRPDVLRQQEKDIYGRFGVSFDLTKVVKAFRASE
jgi:hypothetical protein